MTGFILATALWSPAMLGGQDWGGVTTVLSWVLTGAVFSYAKVSPVVFKVTVTPSLIYIAS